MFKKTRICTGLALAFGSGLFVGVAPAIAQDAAQRIEITGSSIRRIDAEGSLPVTVLKREDIVRTGATSTADLLQRLPGIMGSFGESGSVGGSSFGFASVSIHNIGDTRTLVLLNGRRLAQFGGQTLTGFAAGMDLNAIPISAIDRVEVLTDGASALYGADAIAGVVNFITANNFTTGDLTAGISAPKDGARELRISANKGFGSLETDGWNVNFAAAYDERSKLNATDRDFAGSGQIFFNTNGKKYRVQNYSARTIPANVLDDQFQLISPYQRTTGSCPAKSFRVILPYSDGGVDYADDFCGFDYVGELEIYPTRERGTLMGQGTWRVGKQDLFATALFSKTESTSVIAPVPGAINIPAGTPLHDQYLTPIGITGDSQAFYRFYDLGKRESKDTAEFFDMALGSQGEFMGWDYNASYSHSRSDVKADTKGNAGALAVKRLTESGSFDPFVGPGQQSAAGQAGINAIKVEGYWDGGTSDLDVLQVHGSREIMALANGPMLLGSGVSFQKEKFQSKPSQFAQAKLADPALGMACDPTSADPAINQCDQRFGDESETIPYSADRTSWAVFAEIVAPVAKGLELTGALRYDDYSDFGGATTAKAAFKFKPIPNLLIRGSVGSGFHAPTVPQSNASLQPYGVTSSEYTCTPELQQLATSLNAQCQPGNLQYDVLSAGNPDLKPETSQQASLGLRFDPSPQWSIGADLWWVAIKDAFGQIAEDELFGSPLAYPDAWKTKTDTGTGVVYLASYQPNVNLGKEYYTGIDLDFVGRFKTDYGNVTSQLTGTYMIREDKQLVPNGAYYSAIGNHNDSLGSQTFRWQGRWTNSLVTGSWNHALVMNFKAGYKDATTSVDVLDDAGNVTGQEDIRLDVESYFTFDWQSNWAFRKDMLLSVGALNLFDKAPPLSISSGGINRGQQVGYDDRYYDPRGRTFYANFSYKF